MEEKKICELYSHEIDLSLATPMLNQFLEIKKNYPDTILLYRMGDFYETFFEDAIFAAKDLEITLTSREGGALGRVPMAGVPVKAAEIYISKLIEKGRKIAICEQVQDPKEAKGLVERRVVKTITAGTITDSNLLDSSKNNYLCAVFEDKPSKLFGLAYIDISTAEFKITKATLEQLNAELARISPSEILIPVKKMKLMPFQVVPEEKFDVPKEIYQNYNCTKCDYSVFSENFATRKIKEIFNVNSLEPFGYDDFKIGIISAGAIIDYIEKTQLDNMPKFDVISPYSLDAYVSMDSATRKNLELKETMRDKNKKGSLLWAIDRTCTNMGARFLAQWVQQPLQNIDAIKDRQKSVSEILSNPHLSIRLKTLLNKVYDIERLATKISNDSANARDFVALKDSLVVLPEFEALLENSTSKYLKALGEDNSDLVELASIIDRTILDSPSMNLKEGNLIREGVNSELDYYRGLLTGGHNWLEEFESKERERTGIRSLKVSFSKAFGYFIEITHANSNSVPDNYTRKQTLTNAERYITPELKKHETEVLSAQSKSTEIEYKIFCDLRSYSKEFVTKIRKTAEALAALDVLLSFATVASEQKYTCPIVDNSVVISIKEGRHPVIEQLLPMGNYVANDLLLSHNSNDAQFIILTGPNMAGKSTYMRQNAIIILLTQIGSFVPAQSAHIGVVDKIFTRVGSVDDLSTGQSTFMVEMNETALILNSATDRSFILLDEIGRGTSTYDGVAIAWSVSEYIANSIQARTIFATHYHELNVMCNEYSPIKNFRMTINENDEGIDFLYKVVPGGTSRSYGIQVAKMAGLPESVIARSKNLMSKMQKDHSKNLDKKQKEKVKKEPQLSLFVE
ncbi:MAG: DNA mismatch repair protein MutS [bacterium]